MRLRSPLLLFLLATTLRGAPPTLEQVQEVRERLDAALSRGPEATAQVLRQQPGALQSDWIRRVARADPASPAAAGAVALAYGALSTPARHAAVPLLAAAGGPVQAAQVAPFVARLPEIPGFVRLQSRTFDAVVGMWLQGDPDRAREGLEGLAADPDLPQALSRSAQETAWSLGQLRAPRSDH